MNADAGAFVDPLDAVRRQAVWQLDALRNELAATIRSLGDISAYLARLQSEHHSLAAQATPAAMCAIDPDRSIRALACMTDVQDRMSAARLRIDARVIACDALRQRARAQQIKLDSLDRHREACLHEHLARAEHAAAVEADRDWLARAGWRAQQQVSRDVHEERR
jgi:hypothetical protein